MKERGGEEGEFIESSRRSPADIPEINNYDSAYRHYALNIVEAASKT